MKMWTVENILTIEAGGIIDQSVVEISETFPVAAWQLFICFVWTDGKC